MHKPTQPYEQHFHVIRLLKTSLQRPVHAKNLQELVYHVIQCKAHQCLYVRVWSLPWTPMHIRHSSNEVWHLNMLKVTCAAIEQLGCICCWPHHVTSCMARVRNQVASLSGPACRHPRLSPESDSWRCAWQAFASGRGLQSGLISQKAEWVLNIWKEV